jgi:hypothetical protein
LTQQRNAEATKVLNAALERPQTLSEAVVVLGHLVEAAQGGEDLEGAFPCIVPPIRGGRNAGRCRSISRS